MNYAYSNVEHSRFGIRTVSSVEIRGERVYLLPSIALLGWAWAETTLEWLNDSVFARDPPEKWDSIWKAEVDDVIMP